MGCMAFVLEPHSELSDVQADLLRCLAFELEPHSELSAVQVC